MGRTVIYSVEIVAKNPPRRFYDLRTDYDSTMAYFYGVKHNPDTESIEVCKWSDSEDSDMMSSEVIASYS